MPEYPFVLCSSKNAKRGDFFFFLGPEKKSLNEVGTITREDRMFCPTQEARRHKKSHRSSERKAKDRITGDGNGVANSERFKNESIKNKFKRKM